MMGDEWIMTIKKINVLNNRLWVQSNESHFKNCKSVKPVFIGIGSIYKQTNNSEK